MCEKLCHVVYIFDLVLQHVIQGIYPIFSLADESVFPSRVGRISYGSAKVHSNILTLSFLLCRTRVRRAGLFDGHFAAANVSSVRTNVQNETQPEDAHQVRVRRPEKLQMSRVPVQVHAEHQSTASSYAATQYLSAAKVLST